MNGWLTRPETEAAAERPADAPALSLRDGAAPAERVGRWLRVAPEGLPMLVGAAAASAACGLIGLWTLCGLSAAVTLALGVFLRDPERAAERRPGVVLSGADGKVCAVADSGLPGACDGGYRRVSVFMSLFDVHVNRAPVDGQVLDVEHRPGSFRAAFRDHASEANERTVIAIRDGAGRRHAMAQVAGYLARRIVCRVRPRDEVRAGGRIGLIMFGSRVDHFLPSQYRVVVSVGQRVSAGRTVIGELVS